MRVQLNKCLISAKRRGHRLIFCYIVMIEMTAGELLKSNDTKLWFSYKEKSENLTQSPRLDNTDIKSTNFDQNSSFFDQYVNHWV